MGSKGLHFIGDSAYSIKLFILTPYDNAAHGTPEDNYNFFHSSSRIAVECCFGEVDFWFGIFWRPLKFALKTNCYVIDTCLWLHNFILENSNRSFWIGLIRKCLMRTVGISFQYIRVSLKE